MMTGGTQDFRKPPDANSSSSSLKETDPLNHGISWLETLKSQRKTSSTKEDHSPLNQEIDMGMGWNGFKPCYLLWQSQFGIDPSPSTLKTPWDHGASGAFAMGALCQAALSKHAAVRPQKNASLISWRHDDIH